MFKSSKRIFVILFFFICYSKESFGQSVVTNLTLSLNDCRKPENVIWYHRDTIKIYKLPEDTLQATIIPLRFRKRPIQISSLPVSIYRVAYKNNFGQSVTKNIQLTDTSTNTATLCLDELLNYPQYTLANFQDKDSIVINFQSIGCFHTIFQKIIITKKDAHFIARLYNTSQFFTEENGKYLIVPGKSNFIKKSTLTHQNLLDFKKFENEIAAITSKGCTTTDTYFITSKYWNIQKVDDGCNWNGFSFLKESFFGKKAYSF